MDNSKKLLIVKISALLVYSAVILVGVVNHEYWYDESQAWNIARDNDISGIFAMMNREGHPPLWHLILHIFTSLGCSWRALGLVSWAVSTITAGLIIFSLPVKPFLKAAMLLSGGMIYINSVISRTYCLINLFLVIIALIYPKRKEHPLLFGLMLALLANTHICMCGLVGIYGIYMLIDLFADFGKNTKRQNVLNICGLCIAGIGVILLVLPLIGSTDRLVSDTPGKYTFSNIMNALLLSVTNICKSAAGQTFPFGIGRILGLILEIVLIVMTVVSVRNKRAFWSVIVFSAFFIVIDEIIWYSQPNRGAIFVFALVSMVIAGRDNKIPEEKPLKTGNETLRNLLTKFRAFLRKREKITPFLLSASLLLTAPSGIYFYFLDILGEFDQSKAAAEYIDKNIGEDALLMSTLEDQVPILTYLPQRQIFSINYSRFYTFCSNSSSDDVNVDVEKISKIASEHDDIYLIFPENIVGEEVFYDTNSVDFYYGNINLSISKVSYDEIMQYVKSIAESV